MKHEIEDKWYLTLKRFIEDERELSTKVNRLRVLYSGLVDIDLSLELVVIRFKICLHIVNRLSSLKDTNKRTAYHNMAKQYGMKALDEMEMIKIPEVSDDEKETIKKHPRFREAKELLQQIILAGGGVFWENDKKDDRILRVVAKILARSIKKYYKRDDTYPPPNLDSYPEWVRKLVNLLFPVLVPRDQKPPPYGIEEGEEVEYRYEKIKLPLSQAILYYEEEVLPDLKESLRKKPGDERVQREIGRVQSLLGEYKKLKFIPRATPIVIESGFYTEWFSGYTENGEMLVTVPIFSTQKSGTNLDRLMELVRMDFVKQIATKKLFSELRDYYRYLKSIDSGRLGDSRTPSMKLNTRLAFGMIKREIPTLKMLEDKRKFRKLLDIVSKNKGSIANRKVFKLLSDTDGPFDKTLLE